MPSFTHYSITARLPDIARRTLAENTFHDEARSQIERLIVEIPAGPIRPLNIPLAPDAAQWDSYVQPYAGQNWLEPPWFFIEEYFYERILEATGYYAPGPGRGIDPYALQKRLGLESTLEDAQTLCAQVDEILREPDGARSAIERLLLIDLWGNQNDLSLWPVGGQGEPSPAVMKSAREHILADDTALAAGFLRSLIPTGSRVDILVDNAGYELVCDLAFADVLLSGGIVERVVLHLKPQPVFVSDAMEQDVLATLRFLAEGKGAPVEAFSKRLSAHLASGRLAMRENSFWVSPLALWDLPKPLHDDLSGSSLVISKGDANYRRLLGDRHWPVDTSFAQVVRCLPSAVLALRTLKSEIAVGISPERIPQNDSTWMHNGRWGLVQFRPPQERAKTRV